MSGGVHAKVTFEQESQVEMNFALWWLGVGHYSSHRFTFNRNRRTSCLQ